MVDEIVDVSAQSEFVRVMEYIALRESGKHMTKTAVAEHFGISRVTLDKWIRSWADSGLLAKCRERFLVPTLIEEIRVSHNKALQAWAGIMKRQIDIAEFSDSDKVSNEAAQWLHEKFIEPALNQQESPGADELEYIQGFAEGGFSLDPFALMSGDESE